MMAWLTKSVSDLGPKSENVVYNYSRYLAKFHDQTYIQTCFPSCVLILIMTLKLLKLIAQTVKFFIKDFFSKCAQIRSFLRIWSHLLKKSWMEHFIFRTVRRKCFDSVIRSTFVFRVVAILLPGNDVSVTLIRLLHFYLKLASFKIPAQTIFVC